MSRLHMTEHTARSNMKANQKDGTGDKIEEVFKIVQSMHRDVDNAKWRLNKRILEIQKESREAHEKFMLHKAEIVSLLNEIWDEVDPMEE